MAEPAFHWAVGMGAGAAGCVAAAALTGKRRWLLAAPLVMTAFGALALVPDIPEVFHDYGWLPFASELGTRKLKNFFHGSIGNVFFMHAWLDTEVSKGEVIGLAGVICMYVVCILYYLWELLSLKRQLARCEMGMRPYLPSSARIPSKRGSVSSEQSRAGRAGTEAGELKEPETS